MEIFYFPIYPPARNALQIISSFFVSHWVKQEGLTKVVGVGRLVAHGSIITC